MKGWTVRTESTKNGTRGLASRENYLANINHDNHKCTEEILGIFGNERSCSNMAYAGECYAVKQASRGKGGRPPSSYAIEFTLNLPKGYRPSTSQWRKIVEYCLIEVSKACSISPRQLAKTSRAIVHRQLQDSKTQGTGDHCHLVIGKFCMDGTYLRNLQRKSVTARIKQAFNYATKEYCGFEWEKYCYRMPKQKFANKHAIPTWRIKLAREKIEIDKRVLLIEKEKEILDKEKLLKNNFLNQLEKINKAVIDKDYKQVRRQRNRLDKTILLLSDINLPDEEISELDDCLLSINNKISTVAPNIKPISERMRKGFN
ncbi:hypothetical protein [Vibrio profundi]|uniref:hypothetical protein n=1 Tax=Vibrio profundi TaxID=1774960 RepID=UPI0037365038